MKKEKSNYEMALDLIRTGLTLKQSEENYQRCLDADLDEEYLEDVRKVLEDYESGKLKVTCTEEDKKRIIKEDIESYIQGGMTAKEAETFVREKLKDGTLKFIK